MRVVLYSIFEIASRPMKVKKMVPAAAVTPAAPQLLLTLGGDGRESWLASPAVADLDGDGRISVQELARWVTPRVS